MELKHSNSNGEIVLESKLNHVELFFWKVVKLQIEMNPTTYFFKKRLRLPKKQDWP